MELLPAFRPLRAGESKSQVWRAVFGVAWLSARNAASDASTASENVCSTVAEAGWKAVVGLDDEITAAIAAIPFDTQPYDPIALITSLLQVDLTPIVHIGQCLWLWSIWEILIEISVMEASPALFDTLQAAIDKYGCSDTLTTVPIHLDRDMLPLLDQLALIGGGLGVADLIGQYAARPPTRAEVIQRVL